MASSRIFSIPLLGLAGVAWGCGLTTQSPEPEGDTLSIPSGGSSASTGGSGTAEPAGGGSSGGSVGSGGSDPGSQPMTSTCAEREEECPPGTALCMPTGHLMTCGECGAVGSPGAACVTDLVAEKDGDNVCALFGAVKVACFGEWQGTEVTFTLPTAAKAIAIEDDSTLPPEETVICASSLDGSISCINGNYPFVATEGCEKLAISDGNQACSVCGGHLTCTSGLDVDARVQGLDVSDSVPAWLDGEGQVWLPFDDGPMLVGTYVDFFLDGAQELCAIRTDGALVCTIDGSPENTFLYEGNYTSGTGAAPGRRCLLDRERRVHCGKFEAGTMTESFAPAGQFEKLVSTAHLFCGLSRAGTVSCWDQEGPVDIVPEKLR